MLTKKMNHSIVGMSRISISNQHRRYRIVHCIIQTIGNGFPILQFNHALCLFKCPACFFNTKLHNSLALIKRQTHNTIPSFITFL